MNSIRGEVVVKYISRNQNELIDFLRDLIQIPSVNHGATGGGKEYQEFVTKKYQYIGP